MEPTAPATLVFPQSWPPEERIAIENAAEAWNLEFGTQLTVRSDQAGDLDEPQVRFIVDSPQVCEKGFGGYAGSQKEIELCPDSVHDEPRSLFALMLHEIGHTFGLGHVEGPDSVMSFETESPIAFSDEDHDEFVDIHPNYSFPKGCDVVRRLGARTSLVFLEEEEGVLYTASLGADSLQITTLAPQTEPHHSVVSEVQLEDRSWQLQHHLGDFGSLLTWRTHGGLWISFLNSMQLETPRALNLRPVAENERTQTVTVETFDGLLYVARSISSDTSSVALEVQTFDLETGAPGPTFHGPNMMGHLVAHESKLYVIAAALKGEEVEVGLHDLELNEGALALSNYRDLITGPTPENLGDGHNPGYTLRALIPQVRSTPNGLLIFSMGTLGLFTIDRALTLEHQIELPPTDFTLSVTYAAGPQNRWALGATTLGSFANASEFKVLEMDGTEPLGSWRRVSAPDFSDTENAELFYQGELLISTWADVSKRFVRERKLRCIAE